MSITLPQPFAAMQSPPSQSQLFQKLDSSPSSLSQQFPYRVVRKRHRVPLSCGPCRSRKLKCDRQTPCENCARRNDSASCTYVASAANNARRGRKSFNLLGTSSSNPSSDQMQDRIDRLERMVLSLMSGNANTLPSPRSSDTASLKPSLAGSPGDDMRVNGDNEDDEDEEDDAMQEFGDQDGCMKEDRDEVEEVRNALGVMKVQGGGGSFYRGETHWAVILSEITEFRKCMEENRRETEQKFAQIKCHGTLSKLQDTGFPFSAGRPPTKQEILDLLPAREVVDDLVDTYFKHFDPMFHVLHRSTFNNQYNKFWEDPAKVEVLWLSLLMMILSISLKINNSSNPEESAESKYNLQLAFRVAAEQCLVVGEFTKKLYLHSLQTLILLFSFGEGKEHNIDKNWLLFGILVRIAMSMGMHRDPGQFPDIDRGECEIRRRLWTIISCMDILTSIQVGLPCMIRRDECDTKLPLNYNDDDIGDSSALLPPERDREELTDVSWLRSVASMAHNLWEIVQQVNSVRALPPYEHILRLESDLNERYDQLPKYFHTKSCEDNSVNVPAWLIIQRHHLDLLRQKGLLTLHRPYASKARTNPRYIHSHRQVVSAAFKLLKHQEEMHNESLTILRSARWFADSQPCLDFLHAAMIICLDLSRCCGNLPAWQKGCSVLCRYRDICKAQKDNSHDAAKAYIVISMLTDRLFENKAMDSGLFENKAADNGQPEAMPTNNSTFPTTVVTPITPLSPTVPSNIPISIPAIDRSLQSSISDEQAAAVLALGVMSGNNNVAPNSGPPSFNSPLFNPRNQQQQQISSATNDGLLFAQPDITISGWGDSSGNAASSITTPTAPTGSGVSMDMQGLEWDDWDELLMQGLNNSFDFNQIPGYYGFGGIGSPSGWSQGSISPKEAGGGGGVGI